MDAIEEGLASYGVIFFQPRPPEGPPKPGLEDLIRACLLSKEPRYEAAVVALLLACPESQTRPAVAALKQELDPEALRWLRWYTLAADYFAVIYECDWTTLLGSKPKIPADLFDREGLPTADVDHGSRGWKWLADEIGHAIEGGNALTNWRRTLEAPAQSLVLHLDAQRRGRRAPSSAGWSTRILPAGESAADVCVRMLAEGAAHDLVEVGRRISRTEVRVAEICERVRVCTGSGVLDRELVLARLDRACTLA